MLVNYTNSSYLIFPGFYGSGLEDFNFETEPEAPEGFEYDTRNFKEYMYKVGKLWTDELNATAAGNVIKNIKFMGIDSPKYYNYTTDKLETVVDVNKRALNKYCYHEHASEFNDYLRENWSDRPGFWSFIPNNLNDFKRAENVEIMIEFYLLNEKFLIDEGEFFDFDRIYELQYEQFCLIDKNGVKYDYTISDDGESVIIGGRIACNMGVLKMKKYFINKQRARDLAIDWQCNLCDGGALCRSWAYYITWSGRWERIGRKYGLIREFKENGVL